MFYKRLVKPFQVLSGTLAGPAPVCVWIACPTLPCHAVGWIPPIPTGAAWAGLQFPACLCDQCCRDDLIIGLPWTGHCLVFLRTMSQPRYAAPWGIQSICFLFFFPVISCLPFFSFICVFCSWWPVCPTSGLLAAVPQVWCAGTGCVFGCKPPPEQQQEDTAMFLCTCFPPCWRVGGTGAVGTDCGTVHSRG